MKTNIIFKTLVIALAVILGVAITSASYAQILGSASLNVERRGHTATQIQGGKIVVVGGENTSGVVSQAEVYDSASQTFLVVGTSTARTDHTATLLPDGRVFIAGGRDSVSALDSTEIFNPADNSFSAGPSLKRPRAGHTATTLADGRILIVGGDAEGSAEILDVDHQLATLAGLMAEPRTLHGAALLKDGRVLVAGGVDPADSSVLIDSAEIFNPSTSGFSAAASSMNIARALPTIRVLSDGKVQVIGGDAEWSMEMFDPARAVFLAMIHLPPTADQLSAILSTQARAALISTSIANNPYVQGALSDSAVADLLERADHTVTELTDSDQALVAGGVSSQGQVLSSSVLVESSQAAVTTDKFDYFPGEVVTITGSGFQAGEQISIRLHEEPETHPDTSLTAVADANGKFTNTDFAPAQSDFGRNFSMTATGASGRAAQTAFADASLTINAEQCQNGGTADPGPLPCSGGNWATGNANASKSHWVEGQFLSYRITIENAASGANTLTFSYDVTKSNAHAIDYLGNFDATETTSAVASATNANHNNPCGDIISGCNPAAPDSSAAIGAAALSPFPNAAACGTDTFVGSQIAGSIKAWGVTGLSFGYDTQNSGGSGSCTTFVHVSWTGNTAGFLSGPNAGKAVIAFGGHVATRADWGSNNSAVSIGGSPYHVQMGAISGTNNKTLGTQALQLAAAAVKSQPSLSTTPSPSTASIGATLNDTASLTLGNAPTGSITFRLFSPSDPTCAGTPAYSKVVTVNGNGSYSTTAAGTTTGTNVTNAAGTWNWTAVYSGDSLNNTATSGCGLEPVTVNKVNPGSFTTDIHNTSHTIVTSVGAGSTVHDKATLTANGSLPVPTGTVTFSWFTNGTCSGTATATSGTFTLTSGTVDATTFTQTPAAGSFGFQATYSGDSIYNGGTATCEPLTVNAADPTVATDIHDTNHTIVTSIAAGTIVHDKATVSGTVGTPTGTVTFAWFTNGTCTGTPSATSGTFSLTSGTVDGTTFTQTPNASGSFAFQATYSGDSTYTSKVGPCEPLTVNKVDPTVATTIHDASHGTVTSVAVGTIVHDSATVSATGGNPTPTGTVTFAWFTNGTCTGTASATSGTFSLTSGTVDGTTFTQTPNASGSFAFQATYNGDNTYNSKVGPCEPLTVNKVDPTVATDIHNASHSIVTSVDAGTTVHDSATVSGSVGTPTGTVTFAWFTNGTCTGTASTTSGTFSLTSGTVDGTTFTQTPSVAGSFAFQATYNGDNTYNSKVGPCEPLTVNKVDPTVATDIHNASHSVVTSVDAGTVVHDKATVTGSAGTPTGTVTFAWFSNGTCAGTPDATSGTFSLTSGTVDGTTFTQTPNVSGSFAFQATYNGDNTYNSKVGPCEPLTVNKVDATVATDIHDANHSIVTNVVPGTTLHDKATVTGNVVTPTGTVTFAWFSNGTCSGTPDATSGTFSLTSGTADGTTFTQTPNAEGSFAFQATYNGDNTYNSKVGPCEPLTVAKVNATVATDIHDANHSVVTSVAVGSTVHDKATVTGNSGTPTGTVTFAWFTNGTCTGTPSATSGTFSLTSGTADGTTFTQTPTPAGSFAFQATYNGDNVYNSKVGPCEPLTVNKVNPGSFTTDIHDPSHNVVTSVPVGTTVHDKATLTANGSLPVPTGDVTFAWFKNGNCSGSPFATSGNFSLSGGTADGTSFAQTPTPAGSFAFQATYNGDSIYNSATATCEPLTVNKVDASVSTDIHNSSHTIVVSVKQNTTVHDSATVTGSQGTPTGDVTFAYFTNGTCSGSPFAFSGNFSLSGGTTDGTSFTQTPTAIGQVSFQATYLGDSIYNSKVGACELLQVVSAATDVTISTTLTGGGQTGSSIGIGLNTQVTDQAFLSGAQAATAGGTVTYNVYSDSSCTQLFASGGTKNVTNGVGAPSDPVTFSQINTFYWRIDYSGDANNNPAQSNCTDEQTTVFRLIVKLTPTRDSFLKSEDPNTNEGANRRLRLAATNGGGLSLFASAPKKKKTHTTTISALALGVDRPIAAFNNSTINTNNLVLAQLVFNVATNNSGWGGGQDVEVRVVQQSWTEGNGKNPDLNTGLAARGTNGGTTWNCPIDTNIKDNNQTCAVNWSGADTVLAPRTAPVKTFTDATTGDVIWDVTQDVLNNVAISTINGWVVKKVDENQTGGEVLFFSKEGAAAVSDTNMAPRLILYYR